MKTSENSVPLSLATWASTVLASARRPWSSSQERDSGIQLNIAMRELRLAAALLASPGPQEDGEDEGRGRESQLGPVGHQGGEEGGRDGGQAVADDETHHGHGPLPDAAVLDGQEAGEVRDRVVGTAGRQSQAAQEAHSENVAGGSVGHQSQEERGDHTGAQVTQEVHQVGPEDGRLPPKPVVTKSP